MLRVYLWGKGQRLKTTGFNTRIACLVCLWRTSIYTFTNVLILRNPHLPSLSARHPRLARSPARTHAFPLLPLFPGSIALRPFSFAWVCPLSRHPPLCGIAPRIPIHPALAHVLEISSSKHDGTMHGMFLLYTLLDTEGIDAFTDVQLVRTLIVQVELTIYRQIKKMPLLYKYTSLNVFKGYQLSNRLAGKMTR